VSKKSRSAASPGAVGTWPGRSVDASGGATSRPSSLVSSAGTSTSATRSLQAVARTKISPSSRDSVASDISTLRPGLTTRASTRSDVIGTGRRMSKVTRPTWRRASDSSRSISRPIRAVGGPACCDPGSQGPLVSSLGT
jgi:hypothetical protein